MKHFVPIAFAMICLPTIAFAVGDEDETPPEPTETTTKCTDGQIYDEATQSCKDATDDNAFNDDHRYEAVRELAYAGQFDRALMVIASAKTPGDPRFLNYQGFIYRKQGRMLVAMAFYEAALKANLDYLLARSYMGQGLAKAGDLTGAKRQLAEIEMRGGIGTWAYTALQQAINDDGASDY